MRKFPKEDLWRAIACLACGVVSWIQSEDFGASEFSGGRLTGPLLKMAGLGSLLFLLALLLTFFFRRAAATIALAAVLLCFPFYSYVLMPGPYRWILKGEYSVPLDAPFHWDNRAVVGVFSLFCAAVLSLRSYSTVQTDV